MKTLGTTLSLLLCLTLASTQSIAADQVAKPRSEQHPIETIKPGSYRSRAGYFSQVKITTWAAAYTITGSMNYGDSWIPFTMRLKRDTSNEFVGNGYLTATYENGVRCQHDLSARLWAYEEGLFIESEHPSDIPSAIIGSSCGFAGAAIVEQHAEPYILIN